MAELAELDYQAISDPLNAAFAQHDASILTIVEQALAENRVQLATQPVFATDVDQPVAFFEGLVRIQGNSGRVIPAGLFIPKIEDTALGRKMDRAALTLAFDALAHDPALRLSVNLSARSIGDPIWRRLLENGLALPGTLGERLIFEISQSSAMLLHENLAQFMAEMQPKGVCFALDGFGAGLISLPHLRSFFFDLAKIDKGFIAGIHNNPDNQVLVQALTAVAHEFEMFVVADGVETAAEARFLKEIGVDCLQGYHFGPPQLLKSD